MIGSIGQDVGQTRATTAHDAADPVRETARDLERAFVQEMLKHAGLAEAFAGEGEDGSVVQAFSGFLLEAVATQMVDDGGFGLADRFYNQLSRDIDGPSVQDGSGPAKRL